MDRFSAAHPDCIMARKPSVAIDRVGWRSLHV